MGLIDNANAAITNITPIASNPSGISTVISYISGIVGVVAGILAFVYLVYSGILYLTAGGNPDSAKKGQQGILNAIIGIVIIIAAWAIINAVINTVTSVT